MDYQSISKYLLQKVKITLNNSFWYRAQILSCSEKAIIFREERGRVLTVTPESIIIIEPLEGVK